MIFLAAVAAYLIGSIPTAGWIGRASGVDLRSDGSRNPGANNARRLGGARLAASILFVEIGKGAVAVVTGIALAGSAGGVAAGVAALAGNIYNIWYHFEGGQGLGISAGILLAAWPLYLPVALGVIAVVTALTRRTAKAALVAMVALIVGAMVSFTTGYPAGWGVGDPASGILALGMVVLITPKQIEKLRSSA